MSKGKDSEEEITRYLQGTEVPCPEDTLGGGLGTRYFSAVKRWCPKKKKENNQKVTI